MCQHRRARGRQAQASGTGRIKHGCLKSIAALFIISCFIGNTIFVKKTIAQSDLYTKKEITRAMDAAEKEFIRDFKGCILTDLWYDEHQTKNSGWADQYDAEDAIVLKSNYKSGPFSMRGNQLPNTTYNNYSWVLVRYDDGGNWELQTSGY